MHRQQPTVGKIVHYVNPDTRRCQAAIVTQVPDSEIFDAWITVFPAHTTPKIIHGVVPFVDTHGPDSQQNTPATWHWPELI